jgi:putative hemolysin
LVIYDEYGIKRAIDARFAGIIPKNYLDLRPAHGKTGDNIELCIAQQVYLSALNRTGKEVVRPIHLTERRALPSRRKSHFTYLVPHFAQF